MWHQTKELLGKFMGIYPVDRRLNSVNYRFLILGKQRIPVFQNGLLFMPDVNVNQVGVAEQATVSISPNFEDEDSPMLEIGLTDAAGDSVGSFQLSANGVHSAAVNTLQANIAASASATGTSESLFSTGTKAVPTAVLNRAKGVIHFVARILVTGNNSTDTQTFAIRLGGLAGDAVFTTGAVAYKTNDIVVIEGWLTTRTTGATGTVVAGGHLQNTVNAVAAAKPFRMASVTRDLTADTDLVVTRAASSSNAGNTAVLEDFIYEVL